MHRLATIFLFLLTFQSPLFRQDIVAQTNLPFLSTQDRLAFGAHLFCGGDYLRAHDEFASVPFAFLNDTAKLRLADCNVMLSGQDSALWVMRSVKDEALLREFSLFALRTYFQNGAYNKALQFTQSKLLPDDELLPLSLVAKALLNGQDDYAKISAPRLTPDDKSELVKLLTAVHDGNKKSPLTAALLSAVLPGAGKFYTGRPGDGITAFIMTGLMAFLAVDNYRYGHQFRAGIFSAAALVFYAGNIYGSAASAQIYNEEEQQSVKDQLSGFVTGRNFFLQGGNAACGGVK